MWSQPDQKTSWRRWFPTKILETDWEWLWKWSRHRIWLLQSRRAFHWPEWTWWFCLKKKRELWLPWYFSPTNADADFRVVVVNRSMTMPIWIHINWIDWSRRSVVDWSGLCINHSRSRLIDWLSDYNRRWLWWSNHNRIYWIRRSIHGICNTTGQDRRNHQEW